MRRSVVLVMVWAVIGAMVASPAASQDLDPVIPTTQDHSESVVTSFGRATDIEVDQLRNPDTPVLFIPDVATVTYRATHDLSSDRLWADLVALRDAGASSVLSPVDGVRLEVEFVSSAKHGFDDGAVLAIVALTGEFVLFRDGPEGIRGDFPDPEFRGRWVIESTADKKQVEVRLQQSIEDFTGDDEGIDQVPEPEGPEPVDPETTQEMRDFKFGPEPDLPSSVPDETWVLPDGRRVVDLVDGLGDAESDRPVGNVSIGSSEVIDVAFIRANNVATPSSIITRSKAIIDVANLTMANSGMSTRFRNVGISPDSPVFNTAVPADPTIAIAEMKGGTSPVRGEVTTLRITTQADIVVAIVPGGYLDGYLGWAGDISGPENPTTEYGVFIVDYSATGTGALTPAHELGHILGGGHQSGSGSQANAVARQFYYYGGAPPAQTLMWDTGASNRINYFSSPNVNYLGVPTGTASADNRAAIATWDKSIGDFRRGNYCSSYGTSHSGFVNDIYERLTGKYPTGTAQNTYTTRLTNGTYLNDRYSTDTTIVEISDTAEANVVEELTRLYRTMFNRAPDFAGLHYWLGQRWAGTSLNTVAYYLSASTEFAALHGSSSDATYVNYLYTYGLGRPADPGGLSYWVWRVSLDGRWSVAAALSITGEAVNFQRWRAEVVTYYFGLFERAADPAGLDYWASQFAYGNKQVATRIFLSSSEYWIRC